MLGGGRLRVAIRALEYCVIAGIGMTGGAHSLRIAVIDREPSVIKRGTGPGRGGVTRLAGGRKTRRDVVWIVRALVVSLMARVTVCRDCRVVIVYVTAGAGHRSVRPGQRERRVVVVECGVGPGNHVMARVASSREAQSHMIHGSARIVVIGLLTCDTLRAAQFVVVIDVALRALQWGVRASKGKTGGSMVELTIHPDHGVVATVAGRGETGRHVIHRTNGIVVIGLMAGHTSSARELVVVVNVTLRAGRRQVSAGKSPASGRVIEFAVGPDHGVVAGVASGW